jgi:phasin family protein
MTANKIVKNATAPGDDAVKQIEEAVAVHQETIETVVKAGADVAGKSVDNVVALTKDHVEAAVKASSEVFKGYEDIMLFGKENLEALMASGNIVARGVQDLSKTVVALAQESLEDSIAAGKALVGAKTLKEVIDLSSSLAKSNFDKLVAESSRLGKLSSKLAEEALAPIHGRVDAAVKKLTKTAA